MKFTITGTIPSKKNNERILINKKTGKPFIIYSQKYKDWNKEWTLKLKKYQWIQWNYPITIDIYFYSKDNRKFDLTNKAESIMDTLVDAGIIADDSFKYVANIFLSYMGISKDNPRTEITIDASVQI